LRELPNIDDGIGSPDWRLLLCLLFSWLFIFVTLVRGVRSSGKVAYFTAIFPYIVLLILLVRGVTLEGAGTGIKYFFEPQWDKLYDVKVWYEAVAQCFFSLNTGFGSIMMFSSYNPFKHNIYRSVAADIYTPSALYIFVQAKTKRSSKALNYNLSASHLF